MNDIPNKIYLQIGEDARLEENFKDLEGITWCVDRINKNDIVYYKRKKAKHDTKRAASKTIC